MDHLIQSIPLPDVLGLDLEILVVFGLPGFGKGVDRAIEFREFFLGEFLHSVAVGIDEAIDEVVETAFGEGSVGQLGKTGADVVLIFEIFGGDTGGESGGSG